MTNVRILFHSTKLFSRFFLRLQLGDEFFWREHLLFAGLHVLQRHLALIDFVVAGQHDVGNLLGVGVAELLLHLRGVRIDFSPDAPRAYHIYYRQAVGRLLVAEVDEEHLRRGHGVLGIEVEGVEYVVDAVYAERDAYAR